MSNSNGRKTKSLNDIPEVFEWRGDKERKILLKVPSENVASERAKVLNEQRKDVLIVSVQKLDSIKQSNSENEANLQEKEGLKKAEAEKISRVFKVIPKVLNLPTSLQIFSFRFFSTSSMFSTKARRNRKESCR